MNYRTLTRWIVAALATCGHYAGAAQSDSPKVSNADLVAHGAYVARLGDCVACHTASDGKPMAGGLPLNTPFGAVYSTNITPDDATGIGRYTFAQFERVMRKGIAADGHNLYPAMPYPSYVKMTDQDMRALFAYLKHGVAPVSRANKAPDIPWPFNMRWTLAVWNGLFLDDKPYIPDLKHDAIWNRGAYLVQGLGHCGACHTPRGIGFQEKALSDAGSDGSAYLSGATVDSWRAVNLRRSWTAADLVALLKTGQNRYTYAAGGMSDVVRHSTQYTSDLDLSAIAIYLTSLPANSPGEEAKRASGAQHTTKEPTGLLTTRGGLAYLQFCAACHQVDGRGFSAVFPPLSENPAVLSADPVSSIHVVLTGWQTPKTAAHPKVYTMPAFNLLSDRELADILTFVRTSWGNRQAPVSASDVGKLRRELGVKTPTPSAFETPRFAAMLDQPNAAQLVRGMQLHLETKALLPGNVGNSLNCASCHLEGGTVAHASPFVGVSPQFPSYSSRAGKVISLAERINSCFQRSMNGKPIPVDSADMKAMIAYFDWMKDGARPNEKVPGRGVGKIDTHLTPDVAHGKAVYAAQCASCHGANGEGAIGSERQYIYPPLWGEQSFNVGAGMARLYTAAAFVKHNMPIGSHSGFPLAQGGLSDQDALDVAAYFTQQPRPDFPGKIRDWPVGGKPADARY
ncbi:c-type cytochrome [Burkholderia vietnamiensis]|jgi:thiosulfate dehydrogenase|uniref:c-type cytochrome n=1 Tax=Burkholderia TaxID=32008 RepID=UPI00069838E1|nr:MULTISPECIES: c-type cytochrome [Burkholderia]TPQ42263.1 cytochrome C [Burkholderia ubonensis]AOJ15867.1 cytochrome C [Burkholderia vietnamiensis]AVR12396.1 cytochrome C [Burkholderia vietnamiensis]AXK68065.1 cytochrome C [Burkholderia sp. IDO3]KVF06669.1 cytochrome C [Burkholderia vietnamiensis]